MAKSWKVKIWAALFLCVLCAGFVWAEKQNFWYTNFTTGEISPKLNARMDYEKFASGADTLQNMIIYPQGGVAKRPGFKYISDAMSGASEVRLIPFVFSDDDAFVLEFGESGVSSYIHFYKDGGKIMSSVTPSEQYKVEIPYDGSDFDLIKYTQSADVLYLVHPDYAPQKLIRTSDNDWTLYEIAFNPIPSVDAVHYPTSGITLTATSGTTVTVTADSNSFLISDNKREIHSGVGRGTITGYTDQQHVTIETIDDFASTGPFTSGNWYITGTPYAQLDPEGNVPVGGRIDMYSEWSGGAAKAAFRTEDVGRFISVNNGFVKITNRPSTSHVQAQVLSKLDDGTDTYSWYLEEEAWSASNGYPQAVEFFENRLYFGGSAAYPQTLWGSVVGDYENFAPGSSDDDSVSITLSSSEVNSIRWMCNLRKLIVGTSGAEWKLDGGGAYEPITPSSVIARQDTTFGSTNTMPVRTNNTVIFPQKPGKTLMRYGYDYDSDGYMGFNLNLLAEHLTNNYNIIELAYQEEPQPILYALRDDGDLLACTLLPDQKVVAWSHFVTDGDIESITTIPGDYGDELWVAVRRVIDSAVTQYIEQMQTDDWLYNYERDMATGVTTVKNNNRGFYVDSGLSYLNASGITNISKTDPVVVTAVNDYSNGDFVLIDWVSGTTELNGNEYEVTSAGTTCFSLKGIDGTGFNTYVSGGTAYKFTDAVSGLTHLAGTTVQILADGVVQPEQGISSGATTLTLSGVTAHMIHVGIGYTAKVKTVDLPTGTGLTKKIDEVVARMFRTSQAEYGSDEDNLFPIDFSYLGGTTPFTGDRQLDFYKGWDMNQQIIVQSDDPVPFSISGLLVTFE